MNTPMKGANKAIEKLTMRSRILRSILFDDTTQLADGFGVRRGDDVLRTISPLDIPTPSTRRNAKRTAAQQGDR